ncbi:hypothetical protein OWP16_04610 [Bacillus paranthracis]|uniref:hypothetical protein n=1 Tax=Bacillus paranthracis TaxID=2026186 RepID=UPI00254A5C15|nr:hypothetical protein [Bacillus paranthracis]MDK7419268.1 hypothetical protein [Bacillus paranthracis]MDK7430867.1 hypothetical protein [Bacillus paranthracis]MDK7516568.1 hypothetical protein [Bacillus paranthracis]MDK7572402.1 hypothetical protein [Bacillus paranthracis]
MPQLHETIYGKRLLEHQLPTLLKHLDKIGTELERANDLKENSHSMRTFNEELKRLSNEIADYEPKLAQILDQWVK